MQRVQFSNLVLSVLLICAVVTTGLVVRREIRSDFATVQATPVEPTFIEDWRGVLKHGIRTGPENAAVELVEFGDFQCPYCAEFERRLSAINKRYEGKVAVTFVHSPLQSHAQAEPAALAAECAHAQGRFEAMKRILFEQQAAFASSPWLELGRRANVPDLTRFEACLQSPHPTGRLIQGKELTAKLGVRGTPTIMINGWLLPRPPNTEELESVVSDVLKGDAPRLD